ncbi:hypothetical protein 4 [Monoclea gottschei varicosa-like virus]|uniref:Uncharacterized protein n=1 Tax=Monoclea gottschei varicosa-like virus TaxID=2933180 RepID=A0A9C7GWF6_9RHAB|nr:hypothetical protein 4 [Monoclea gottschei varicosa-like virus]CAI5383843.1 hypothetical protein 4 [Monoclea gottschei varicosa-like virus]
METLRELLKQHFELIECYPCSPITIHLPGSIFSESKVKLIESLNRLSTYSEDNCRLCKYGACRKVNNNKTLYKIIDQSLMNGIITQILLPLRHPSLLPFLITGQIRGPLCSRCFLSILISESPLANYSRLCQLSLYPGAFP